MVWFGVCFVLFYCKLIVWWLGEGLVGERRGGERRGGKWSLVGWREEGKGWRLGVECVGVWGSFGVGCVLEFKLWLLSGVSFFFIWSSLLGLF